MLRRMLILVLVAVLALAAATPAFALPGKPDFSPGVYGDGEAWGTKGAALLKAPTAKNIQSYDKLFVFTNGVTGQLPVAEAAPGNPMFNGGRWFTQTVTWTTTPVLLKSYAEVMAQYNAGNLTIVPGSPNPAMTPDYFECPLLPVKDGA